MMKFLKVKRIYLALVYLALASAACVQAQNAAPSITPAQKCADLTKLQIPGSGMTITKTQSVSAAAPGMIRPSQFADTIQVAVPSYCRADGVIDPRTGFDGRHYGIEFAIALPDKWNGRFLFQGGGGLNGSVGAPFGTQAAGKAPALTRGFAVVSTDTGHESAVFDPSFMKDQLAALDFAYIAVGRVAVLAKQIIASYYGQPAKHSYFDGCSTGGREAMLMSQRYPTYFDGIISGDPAMETGYSNIGLSWATRAFAEIAPKGPDGKPDPTKDFSSGDRKLIADAILKACDDKDGLKDGMIFNRAACQFDPAVLQCSGDKTDSCLSSGQVKALQEAFGGPKDSRGEQVYPRFPFDADMVAEPKGPGFTLGFLPMPGPNILGNVLPPKETVDEQVASVRSNAEQTLTDTATWTDLNTFSEHGGKLIFYHGTSDPWFSFLATLGYYKQLGQDPSNGGMDQVQTWSRFFLVPGMSHCMGGAATLDDFDMLTAIVDWVEKGQSPEFVIATGKSFPGRSRPLCAYPKYARYKGTGDPEKADSFECVIGGPVQ